jgi:hypothetical protein
LNFLPDYPSTWRGHPENVPQDPATIVRTRAKGSGATMVNPIPVVSVGNEELLSKSRIVSAAAPPGVARLTVELGSFAFGALGGEDGDRQATATSLARAIDSYWQDRETGRPGWVFPAQIQERSPAAVVDVELDLDEDTFEGLTEEARRRGVSLSQLATHAALYYVARLDAEQSAGS